MFIRGRSEILKVVSDIQRSHCCYDMGFSEKPPSFCDCKYGFSLEYHKKGRLGEQTGCPELRCVAALLSNMTDEEYDSIMSRDANNIDSDKFLASFNKPDGPNKPR